MRRKLLIAALVVVPLLFLIAALVLTWGGTTTYERPADIPFMRAIITAYTSDPAETDDTPNITASGTKTRDGVAANNCLPFGTEIDINGEIYVVEDRMNRRYGCNHYDLWKKGKYQAEQFGVQELPVKINP